MNKFLKIAHRGYSKKYPENTLISFNKAIEFGANVLELDTILSKDGHLVVIHNDYIDSTSNGEGLVKNLTLKELRKYNYNTKFPKLGRAEIPTLQEVIDLARGRAMLNIEIKNTPVQAEGIEEALLGLLKKNDFLDDVIVSSFDHYALKTIKKIATKIKTGMLYDAVWIKFRDELKELKVYSIHPHIDGLQFRQLEWAKKNGYMDYPWVAKDRTIIGRLYKTGLVDGIMVNDLELFDYLFLR